MALLLPELKSIGVMVVVAGENKSTSKRHYIHNLDWSNKAP